MYVGIYQYHPLSKCTGKDSNMFYEIKDKRLHKVLLT